MTNFMYPEIVKSTSGTTDLEPSVIGISGYRPLIFNKRPQALLPGKQVFLSGKPLISKKPVAFTRKPAISAPDEETVRRLNDLAKRPPFNIYCKNQRYDPL